MSEAGKQVRISDTVGGSALSQYALCKTPGGAVVTTGSGDEPFGVVQDGAAASGTATFVIAGPTKAIASEAISKGDKLQPAASGKVAVHDGTAGDHFIGVAREAASGDGHEFDILLNDDKAQTS